jgi:multicomponent Na+:H+ antiporter subunit E
VVYAGALAVAIGLLWFGLSGFTKPLLLTFGVMSTGLAVIATARLGRLNDTTVPWKLIIRAPLYWLWLFKEIGKANLQVARQALSLKPDVNPNMFTVPVDDMRTDLGRATYANSVTLTPGTVTVMISHDEATIHALNEDVADLEGLKRMEKRVHHVEEHIL